MSFSRLIQHTGLYALGNVLVKASGFLVAPFYLNTALLSAEAYGYFELLWVTGQLAILVAGLGVSHGLLKYLTDPAFEEAYPYLPFTALVAVTGLGALAGGLFWFGAPGLANMILGAEAPVEPVRVLGLYVVLQLVGQVPYTLLRTHERVGWYVAAKVIEALLLVAGVYYFLVLREDGLVGILYAYVAATGVGVVLLGVGVMARLRLRLRLALVRPLMRYGAPLVLAGLASQLLNMGDRFLLNWLIDAPTVGLYGWAAKLGGVINMLLVQSLQLAFSVLGLKALGVGDVSLHRKAFKHYVAWAGWAVLGLSLLSYDVTRLVGDPLYLAGDPLVFPVALGFMAFGIHVLVNNVLYARGRTRLIGLNMASVAVLNVVLNLALIPIWGAMGAAVATFASYLVLALAAAYFAEREVAVGYPWLRFVVVLVLVVGLYAAALPSAGWEAGPRLAVRAAAIAAYLPLLLACRIYTREEVRAAWKTLKKWRSPGEEE